MRLLVVLVMVAVYVAAIMGTMTYAADVARGETAPTCYEDDPTCWDCHTMGNGICGPGFILNGRAHVATTSRPWTWQIN